MTPTTRPRARVPARVFWVRRGMVLLTALLLVFAIGRLLGSGGGSGGDTAGQVASRTTPTARTPAAPATTTAGAPAGPVGVRNPAGVATGAGPQLPLAQPSGPCDVNDITVTPTIATATAGGPVMIGMQLTGIKAACTFEVSSRSIAVRIAKGNTRIWTSQQCPAAIRSRSLVVRSAVAIPITVRWSGRRSDDTCSRATEWALPGNYTVTVAAIGSQPALKGFALLGPPRPVITKTITPKPRPTTAPPAPTATTTWGNGDNALPHKATKTPTP